MRNRFQDTREAGEWSQIDVELRGLTLQAVAGSMGVHRHTVSRRLRRATGRTWREQRSCRREEKAKQLLAARLSVKEVAFILRFGSASAFSRFFRKRTGVRPSKWWVQGSTKK